MKKVITYGTFDLLHYGHIRLLERARALGDYLIVGVTSDDYDMARGKINVHQSLTERIEAVKQLGIADEVIVEEYEGQKIDDIKKYNIDIFTVGSDWVGKFDFLNEYCKVVYLERTDGVSSTDIRKNQNSIKFGLVGESISINKFAKECCFVNGVEVVAIYSKYPEYLPKELITGKIIASDFNDLLDVVDAVYITSNPKLHYQYIKLAMERGKHIICDSPLTLDPLETEEVLNYSQEHNIILLEGNKTAYSTAYCRLILLLQSGKIGNVVSIDVTCTSLNEAYYNSNIDISERWNSIEAWGSKCLLPVFQIMGCKYLEKKIISKIVDEDRLFDAFTKIDFRFPHAVASIKVGKGIKSEGDMIISGTKGYVYVPAPWWKTDYFEIRYENQTDNKRYFYQLDGEGIRYEVVKFMRSIESKKNIGNINKEISITISGVMKDYYDRLFDKI